MATAFPLRQPAIRFEAWPLVWLWPLALVFVQVPLLRLGDFEVTVGVIACHALQLYLLVFYWTRRPSAQQTILYLVVALWCLALGAFASNALEFFRSMAHVANLLVMVALCLNIRLEKGTEVGRSLTVFLPLAALVAGVVILQSISLNLFNDLSASRLLGEFSPPRAPGEGPYVPSELARVSRANGWFSEPSVAGWFLNAAAALALAARGRHPGHLGVIAAICLAGACATFSLTGILGALIVFLAHLAFVQDRRLFKLVWVLFAGAGLLAAVWLAWQLGVVERYREISQPGTSVYFRMTAPFLLVSESLLSYPFGYPLGQTDFISSRDFFVNWVRGSQTNIDHTWFKIAFHFGLLGLLFNAVCIAQIMACLLRRRRSRTGLIMLGVALILVATGAGWAHQSVLIIGYAILVGRYLLRQEPEMPRIARAVTGAALTRRPKAAPQPGDDRPREAAPRAPSRRRDGAP